LPREPARLIGIGASAGGIDALLKVVGGLPRDLPHAIFVVLHLPATGSSVLAEILDRKCALTVTTAAHGERIARGRIYCAPPDAHVEVRAGWIVLTRGPKENGVRPAADVTLRSLARAVGPQAVAVVLSGALGDGSAGAEAVANAGGCVIVQDPADAIVASMPEHAIARVGAAARRLPADRIGAALAGLPAVAGAIGENAPVTGGRQRDVESAEATG
jgi:two-component system chemotaxis response regulator CheB